MSTSQFKGRFLSKNTCSSLKQIHKSLANLHQLAFFKISLWGSQGKDQPGHGSLATDWENSLERQKVVIVNSSPNRFRSTKTTNESESIFSSNFFFISQIEDYT